MSNSKPSYLYPFLINHTSGATFINVVAAPNYMTAVLEVINNCGEGSDYTFLKLSEFVILQAEYEVHIAALDYGVKEN